jgi:hypothetical protein
MNDTRILKITEKRHVRTSVVSLLLVNRILLSAKNEQSIYLHGRTFNNEYSILEELIPC